MSVLKFPDKSNKPDPSKIGTTEHVPEPDLWYSPFVLSIVETFGHLTLQEAFDMVSTMTVKDALEQLFPEVKATSEHVCDCTSDNPDHMGDCCCRTCGYTYAGPHGS